MNASNPGRFGALPFMLTVPARALAYADRLVRTLKAEWRAHAGADDGTCMACPPIAGRPVEYPCRWRTAAQAQLVATEALTTLDQPPPMAWKPAGRNLDPKYY